MSFITTRQKYCRLLLNFETTAWKKHLGGKLEVICQCLSYFGQRYGIYITEKYIKRAVQNVIIVAREFAVQISNSRAHLSRRSAVTTIMPEFVIFHTLEREMSCF
jgi:hypothetical protein